MIHLVYGEASALEAFAASEAQASDDVLWLHSPQKSQLSWDSIRRFLPQVETRIGRARLEDSLAKTMAAASVVLPGLRDSLSERQVMEASRLSARWDSHLSHNMALQRPLLTAWAKMFIEWLKACGGRLLITSPLHLDRATLGMLKIALRHGLSSSNEVIIGYDRTWSVGHPDEHGLYWRYPLSSAHYLLLGLPIRSTKQLASEEFEDPRLEALALPVWEQYECDQELRLLEGLRQKSALPSSEKIVTILQQAFATYGFRGALQLGLQVLAHGTELTPTEAAMTHEIVTLAAHNEQFYSLQDEPINAFLEEHLRKALAAEPRLDNRCALLYRLAVTLGRRQKRFSEAMHHAMSAIHLASSLSSPLHEVYQEAWARNIRAYLRMRLGDVQGAVDDEKEAFRALESAASFLDDQAERWDRRWDVELKLSQAVVASNLRILASRTSEREYRTWVSKEIALGKDLQDQRRYTAADATVAYRRSWRLDLAKREATEGLVAAEETHDGFRICRFLTELADLDFKLGNAEAAAKRFLKLKELTGPYTSPERALALNLAYAVVATRTSSDQRRKASRVLQEARQSDWLKERPEAAEVAATSGLLAALQGDRVGAEEALDQGIDCAVQSGRQDVLLRVALVAGNANEALGRTELAREAWQRGLEIGGLESSGGAAGVSNSPDLLYCLIRLMHRTSVTESWMRVSFRFVPEALEEGEAWWYLQSWVRGVVSLVEAGAQLFEEEEIASRLALLLAVAEQRADVREIVREVQVLLRNLPTHELPGELLT